MDFQRPPRPQGLHGDLFRKWVDVSTEYYNALAAIRERVSDPLLLMHLVMFMHGLRSPPRDVIGREAWEKLIDDAEHAMNAPFVRLSAYVQAIADDADVPMEILFGADEPPSSTPAS